MKNFNIKRRTLIIDLIFLLILLCTSAVSFYIAYSFGLLPKKWITMAASVIIVLFLILLLLSFKRLPTWGLVIKRFFIILLAVMVGTCGYFLDKSRTTLTKMSKTKVNVNGTITTTKELYIIVKKDAPYSSLSDLSNTVIGFQNGSDANSLEFAKTSLSADLPSYTPKEEIDYTTLITNLQNGAVSAVAISENYYNMSKANIDGFEDQVKILKTYTKETTSKSREQKDLTKDVFTIYLSGLDNMGSPDQQTRTDTNLILIVNPVANHIDMVSLPRDGYMPNTALNNANDKLTHTGIYGIDASVETIEQFFGIPVDFYARVSFNSMIEIVDTIGGINVDVELDFCEQDENRSFKKDDLICLKKGEQKLDGKQALAYSRHRKTEGYDNAGRERAQQRIIKSIIDKLLSPSAITYVNNLLEIAPNYVITDMSPEQITSFVSNELDSLKPWTISSIISDTGVYDSQYAASLNPADGLSDVYLFTKDEVQAVMDAYDGAKNQLKMDEFHFNMDNLFVDTPQVNDDPNIVWNTMASNPH